MINWKEHRIRAGLTQKTVSEKLGYESAQFVSNWERGISHPPPKAFKMLCKFYNLPYKEYVDHFVMDQISSYENDLKKKMGLL